MFMCVCMGGGGGGRWGADVKTSTDIDANLLYLRNVTLTGPATVLRDFATMVIVYQRPP